MNFKKIAIVLVISLFFVACGQEFSEPKAPLDGSEQVESTDDGYLPIGSTSPVRYDEQGESRDVEKDKRIIIDAAEMVPGVKVEAVQINREQAVAHVTVSIDEELDRNERLSWKESIETAITGAIHHYEIKIDIN